MQRERAAQRQVVGRAPDPDADLSGSTIRSPLVVFSSQDHYTLPLAVANFQSTYTQDTARVYAFTAVSMIPALAIFIFAQRKLVGGLVGAIRG